MPPASPCAITTDDASEKIPVVDETNVEDTKPGRRPRQIGRSVSFKDNDQTMPSTTDTKDNNNNNNNNNKGKAGRPTGRTHRYNTRRNGMDPVTGLVNAMGRVGVRSAVQVSVFQR